LNKLSFYFSFLHDNHHVHYSHCFNLGSRNRDMLTGSLAKTSTTVEPDKKN